MGRIWASCFFLTLLWSSNAFPESAEWVTIGRDVHAFHEDTLRDQKILVEPAVTNDAAYFIQLLGIPNAGKINALRLQIRRSIGIKNAVGYTGDGYRTIVYDPVWAQSATAASWLVLAHEAGHFFCGHDDLPQSPKIELEADRFAGASIKRLEVYTTRRYFDDVMAAASNRYLSKASIFYPSRFERLAAIKDGYEHGSPCGNLAPVVQSWNGKPQ